MPSHTDISQSLKNNHGIHLSHADFQTITVIPSYRSNISRSQHALFAERFSTDMQVRDFCWMIDRLQTTQGLRRIIFTGGEPTLWAGLDEALYYARQHSIETILLTDGFASPAKSLPDQVWIHAHAYLQADHMHNEVEKVIDFYKTHTRGVRLKLFVLPDITASQIDVIKHLAKKLQVPLDVQAGYAMQDLHCANCPYARMTIQPDAQTVTLCHFLPYTGQLDTALTLSDIYERYFRKKLARISEPACRQTNDGLTSADESL